MDQEAQRPLGRQPSLAQVLNKDCLQELFARCPTRDLLQLQQTCKLFHAFVADSPTVWARRLLADFGLKLALTPTVTGRDLSSFARELYAAPGDEFLRFQGVLVNGGIDGETATYWADNLFKADRSPYCSDSSENADCLALLLDGEVPREQQYNTVRQYMQRRCRYAAALLAQLNNADDSGIDELMNLVEHWSDPHLEHFFMVLVVGMDEEHPMGRLLLYDIPHDRLEAETTRLRSVRAYLRDRPKAVFQSLLQLPGPSKTVFDTTVMDKLGTRCESRLVGVIREIEISRAGSLTCPVASGVVLAGVWDRTKLEGCTPQEAAHKLQEASQAPIVAQFNGIDSLEALAKVVHGQKGGGLQLAAVERTSAGVVVQFKEESGAADEEPSDVLIRWRPLFWFRFNSREEAAAAQALVPAAEPGVVLGGDHAPEAAAGAGAVAPAAAVAGPSGGNGEAAPAHAGPTSGDGALSSSESSGGESSHMGTESSEASQFSDEDMEEMQQGQEMQFAEGPDEAFEEIEMGPDRTVGCNRLTVTLTQQCAATALLVKMVDQENLMEELEDLNPYPNIDMTYVVAKGKRVALPAGVQARP